MKSQLLLVGESRSPVVVIDDFTGSVDEIVAVAGDLGPFVAPEGTSYPGVRRFITKTDESAYAYVMNACRTAAPLVGQAFGVRGFDLREANFSMMTVQPGNLQPIQKAPHFDDVHQNIFALLHYLRVPAGTGTAFFRHRATNIERVTTTNGMRLYAATLAETATLPADAGYIHGSNQFYEQIAAVEAAPDRAIIYNSTLLHSAIVPPTMSFGSSPEQVRLTGNIFLLGRGPSN